MTRDELWTSFTSLISEYVPVFPETDIDSFVVGMMPNPTGRTHDPALQETYHRLFHGEPVEDLLRALPLLADFVDEELVGWWKILPARRIAEDLRSASKSPESAPEPVRSWIRSHIPEKKNRTA